MELTPKKPTDWDLLDRCRILTCSMLEIDDHSTNYILLQILADQLYLLHEAFKEAEGKQLQHEKLTE